MSGIVFGDVDPRTFVVPEGLCMACRHEARRHDSAGTDFGAPIACPRCSCERRWCSIHDALDEEHECDEEVDW